ncbi:MAG: hypothetical protein QXI91_06130 [Candidatus Bathyarchaeia archaeon]
MSRQSRNIVLIPFLVAVLLLSSCPVSVDASMSAELLLREEIIWTSSILLCHLA